MRIAILCATAALTFSGVACSGLFKGSSVAHHLRAVSKTHYSGTASVGDFITMTIDHDAHTIDYTNHSNGDAAVVDYTVNVDGSYAVADSNITDAWEIPGYALVARATHTGAGPVATYTDLVIDGTTDTDVTSAAFPFDATAVDSTIHITSGTGFNTGDYQVISVTGVVARLDRTVGITGSSGGSGAQGGYATSLVSAILTQPTTVAAVSNKNYNYMQFRTNSGGIEFGHVGIDGAGTINHASFWPYGSSNPNADSPFSGSSGITGATEDPATGALKLTYMDGTPPVEKTDYVFATTGGFLSVDTGNGGLVCMEKPLTTAFDPANAAVYDALYFAKDSARTGANNSELSAAAGDVMKGTVTILANGTVTIADEAATVLATGTLTAIADDVQQYDIKDPGTHAVTGHQTITQGIGDDCAGMFVLHLNETVNTISVTREIAVTFIHHAILFSSFRPHPQNAGDANTSFYDYLYGVALKQVSGG